MLNSKFLRIRWTHISLALVGLMWVFPFLHVTHKNPITTFYQEWWSVVLGVLALGVLLVGEYGQKLEIPRIVLLPVGLIAVVLLQIALGMFPLAGQGLLFIAYLVFAASLMILGASLRSCFGIEKLAIVLAIFLLLGAESNALLGVLQHYHWHTPLDALVVRAINESIYGNLAQANHFADYIALGLISLGLLLQMRKLPAGYVALLATPLLFVMTLSGSRSSWLYLVLICVLAAWGARQRSQLRPLFYYGLSLLAGFVAMIGIVQLPFMQPASGGFDIAHRMFVDASSGHIRLYLWHEAWLMFVQSPWLGSGFGQFAWAHFQLGPQLQRTSLLGLYNNAHNLIFQLAAETGIAGLTVLFATLGVWLYGLRRAVFNAARWWGYAALGVLALHSLLEYPLWYAYFLAIAAVLLGALDAGALPLRGAGWRVGMAVVMVVAALSLLQLRTSYQQLEVALTARTTSGNTPESARQFGEAMREVQKMPLLSSYADFYSSSLIVVNEQGLKEKLALNSRTVRAFPIEELSYLQAMLLAQDGQLKQAEQVWEQAIWSYPFSLAQRNRLEALAEKDPAHFSALLEFDLQKDQEHARAVYYK